MLGHMEPALKHYRRAFDLNPVDARNLHGLLQLDRKSIGDKDLEIVEALLKKPDLPLKDRSSFYFALGSIDDRDKNYDKAFTNFSVANLAKGLNYDADQHASYITQVIQTFTPELFKRHADNGNNSSKPVFIVGIPRSGTTLVEQILASHPQVHAAGELTEVERLATAMSLATESNSSYPQGIKEISTDLVQKRERYSRRLIRAVGLEWSASCHDFYKTERPVHTASVVQVRQPMYTSSVDRWRHYEKHLQPLKSSLGIFDASEKIHKVRVESQNFDLNSEQTLCYPHKPRHSTNQRMT